MADLNNLKDHLGLRIKKGAHVLYVRNGNVDQFFNEYTSKGKYIWKVVRVKGHGEVEVANACGTSGFSTLKNKLVLLSAVVNAGYFTTQYINPAHYQFAKDKLYLKGANTQTSKFINYLEEDFDLTEDTPDEQEETIYDHYQVKRENPCGEIFNTPEERKSIMKDLKRTVMAPNTEAAKVAARITAGKTINKVVMDQARPHLPLMLRGYADHALAEVVLANICNFVVQNFANRNEKAMLATEVMMQAAMVEFLAQFNFEQMISEVLAKVNLAGLADELPDTE